MPKEKEPDNLEKPKEANLVDKKDKGTAATTPPTTKPKSLKSPDLLAAELKKGIS